MRQFIKDKQGMNWGFDLDVSSIYSFFHIMSLTPQQVASQLLVERKPPYNHIDRNHRALDELWKRIESTYIRSGRISYAEWAEGVKIVMPDGRLHTIGPNYLLDASTNAVNEFLEYLALRCCANFGFLGTSCVVNKPNKVLKAPSEAFFDLALEVGLLPDPEDLTKSEIKANRQLLLDSQATAGFRHDWKGPQKLY